MKTGMCLSTETDHYFSLPSHKLMFRSKGSL